MEEAAENRNYLSGRMTEEVNEVIRVLQLTTYDEDEWNSDNVTVMRKAVGAVEGDLQNAHDWIKVRRALQMHVITLKGKIPLEQLHNYNFDKVSVLTCIQNNSGYAVRFRFWPFCFCLRYQHNSRTVRTVGTVGVANAQSDTQCRV